MNELVMSVIQWMSQWVSELVYQSFSEWVSQSVIYSMSEWVSQSVNESVNRPVSQSVQNFNWQGLVVYLEYNSFALSNNIIQHWTTSEYNIHLIPMCRAEHFCLCTLEPTGSFHTQEQDFKMFLIHDNNWWLTLYFWHLIRPILHRSNSKTHLFIS